MYLVTEFNKKLKDAHFTPNYAGDYAAYPKSYAFKKSEFLEIQNALKETKQVIKTNVFTRRKI